MLPEFGNLGFDLSGPEIAVIESGDSVQAVACLEGPTRKGIALNVGSRKTSI
jgi:hypothetical protein